MTHVPNWDQVSDKLIGALSTSLPTRRCKLLPRVLKEWGRTDLRRHLSIESRTITRVRIRKLETVEECARKLLQALNAVDGLGRTGIVVQMIIGEGRPLADVSRAEFANRTTRLNEEFNFLANLGAIESEKFWKLGRGRPHNLVAHFILRDVAAIYEWLTDRRANREVDRENGSETGLFFEFASTLWPALFGNVRGLSAAMKNWAKWKSVERSALIANMALRHPTWRLIQR